MFSEDLSEMSQTKETTPRAASAHHEATTELQIPLFRSTYPVTDLDQNIVAWDSQDDPKNPRNFSTARKWALLILVTIATLISPLASSMFAPAVVFMAEDFQEDNQVILSFSVSVFVLGYAFGPLFLAPLSELYGRRIVLSISNAFFFIWQIGCATAPNITSLIIFRFFAGVGGSGSITIVPGVVADLFEPHQRGVAMSGWTLGVLLGPIVGPICGGFIGQQLGWRWVYWILLIVSGTSTVVVELTISETCPEVLIRWKARQLRTEYERPDLRSFYDKDEVERTLSQTLRTALVRPLLLLVKSPIVFFFASYMSFTYGLLYLFFTTIPAVFRGTYGWSPQMSGLAYLGLGLGFLIGLTISAVTSDKRLLKLAKNNNGKLEPEMRLPGMVLYASLLPITFFWYGWSAEKETHWIVPIIGTLPFAIGLNGIFVPIQLYLVDSYTTYAASAVAVLTATRSLVGGLLPLAGQPLFESLGLGWGNSLLGFLALSCIPIPLFFLKYGKYYREKYPVFKQI